MSNTSLDNRIGILFLGGAKRVSMGQKFIDAARELGYNAELFSYELSAYVPIASIAKIIIGRKWSAPDIVDHIHDICQKENIQLIVPFVDGAVETAACVRDKYGEQFVPVGDTSSASVMFDKIAADALFRKYNLPVPGNNRFPLIAKPRFGSASKGIFTIDSMERLKSYGDLSTDYLVQEYIENRDEITVDCYVTQNNTIICTVPRIRIEVQGGEASVTETITDKEAEALAREVIKQTGLKGAVTVQILRDKDTGRLMLMEINPRLGGGAVCSCHAGAMLPKYILMETIGQTPEPCIDWHPHTLVTRYFAEVSFRL